MQRKVHSTGNKTSWIMPSFVGERILRQRFQQAFEFRGFCRIFNKLFIGDGIKV